MPRSKAEQIIDELGAVAKERDKRNADPALGLRVNALKAYQQRRFALTHADLLNSPRYRAASLFFLEQLYGPEDFSNRDGQFARVVPAMVRLFPDEVVDTVASLASLHSISERLDSIMASYLETSEFSRQEYVAAWQSTGNPEARESQVSLSLAIGESLDRLTTKSIIRHSLRLMRGPAKASGLSDLQTFLESGFEAFRAMRGAQSFLDSIGSRERRLISILNSAEPPFADPELAVQLP